MESNIVQKIPQFKNDENKALNFFKEYGFHIENAVYSEDECDNLIKQSFNFQNFINTTYIPEQQIHKKNKMVMDMMKKNKMVDIIKKFASNSIEMFGVQSTFFYGVPGTSGSASHQDSLWVKPEDANGFISAWTPLVDLEEDNMGNLFVYEKSHRYGDLEVVEKKQYNKQCRYGQSCNREDCSFSHTEEKKQINKPCRFGQTCNRPNCWFTHSDNADQAVPIKKQINKLCKFGNTCQRQTCWFVHPSQDDQETNDQDDHETNEQETE